MPLEDPELIDTVHDILTDGGNTVKKERMYEIQEWLLTQQQADVLTEHEFGDAGTYIRKMTAPTGTLLVGSDTKTDSLVVLLEGEITVWTEQTGQVRLKAPAVAMAQAGSKRVGFVHERVVWANIFSDVEVKELKELEGELYVEASMLMDRIKRGEQ